MSRLAYERYCDEITVQTEQLTGALASGADPAATVATCPDWSLEELVRHVGRALRWTDQLVRTRATENIPWEKVPDTAGPDATGDAAALGAWLTEAAALVTEALREAGPDAPVWAWNGESTAGFWARRMTHEVAVHRADATLTAGLSYALAPEVAADAIDEWLQIVQFIQRAGVHEAAADLRGDGRSIHLHATDAPAGLNAEWLVELAEEGVRWRRGHEKATVALRGPLTDVLLAFYRRIPLDTPGLEILGERELLEFWLRRASFG
ncbi:maleylpyruvate isomerase family mycothiol-dependent enzyme [Streptomyces sp. NPDC014806]|uniref:maleylpyruvate isomerase family mycothiol-dependent enzyme n=1 Tax=Streptomyces sp. NPDC014806 TaxID=3364920 RepID=UPI0037015F94